MAELNPVFKEFMDDFSITEPLADTLFSAPARASHMLEHRSLKRLIDFLFLPSTHVMPNERIFAESLILRDWDNLPDDVLRRLAERLSGTIETAPRLALKLANCGRTEISTPLLQSAALNDFDLVSIVSQGGEDEQLLVATRCNLPAIVSGILVEIGTDKVVKAILMNADAKLSAKTLDVLINKAKQNSSMQSALLVRPEMTAPVALRIFWGVPGEVREYILLSYLCDQRSLTGFLHEDSAWQEHQRTLCPAGISDERLRAITKLMVNGERDIAIERLSHYARLAPLVAAKILKDKGGEAFLVAAKAMGASRAGVNEALMRFINAQPCVIGSAERLEPLRNLFDSISRDQALVALQYWGWEIENTL